MTREEILKAMETEPPGGDFLWDGVDEDERPVTQEEWDAARAEYRRRHARTDS